MAKKKETIYLRVPVKMEYEKDKRESAKHAAILSLCRHYSYLGSFDEPYVTTLQYGEIKEIKKC